jgi:hypothetical protein
MTGRIPRGLLAAVCAWNLVALCACSKPEIEVGKPPATGGEAVSRLISLSRIPEPGVDALAQVLDPEALEADRVAALEALASLGEVGFSDSFVERALPGLGRQVVELEGALPGEGSATFSFQTREQTPGSWRVISFRGPGVGWPPRAPARGPGLSTSAPPGEQDR